MVQSGNTVPLTAHGRRVRQNAVDQSEQYEDNARYEEQAMRYSHEL